MVSSIDHDGLSALQRQISHVDVGERILSGRVQLFHLGRNIPSFQSFAGSTNDVSEEVFHRFKHHSPLGPLNNPANKALLNHFIQVLGIVFPEYDYTSLAPDRFEPQDDGLYVVNQINCNCFSLAERQQAGFINRFWQVIRDVIDIGKCKVFLYKPESLDEIPHTPLFSFFYFFLDQKDKKLLFLFGSTRSKYQGVLRNDDLSDISDGVGSSSQGMMSDDYASSSGLSTNGGGGSSTSGLNHQNRSRYRQSRRSSYSKRGSRNNANSSSGGGFGGNNSSSAQEQLMSSSAGVSRYGFVHTTSTSSTGASGGAGSDLNHNSERTNTSARAATRGRAAGRGAGTSASANNFAGVLAAAECSSHIAETGSLYNHHHRGLQHLNAPIIPAILGHDHYPNRLASQSEDMISDSSNMSMRSSPNSSGGFQGDLFCVKTPPPHSQDGKCARQINKLSLFRMTSLSA
ncbi:unnamed protein product [Amoebophrya sp. A120]|nr:unnamed protein product [Amoebophrya sp. A120]|eukprot:GSA120T00001109001.1